MGRFAYETFDPDELDLPNDMDFEDADWDESYESYQEYAVYMPDMTGELQLVSGAALASCAAAEKALERAREVLRSSSVGAAAAQLLLYAEAISTTKIENYQVSCASMLDYAAAAKAGRPLVEQDGEAAAADAIDALVDFVGSAARGTTVDDLCRVNELLGRTSERAEYCGVLRDRPVFIGASLFDAAFVPPPADYLEEYMEDLAQFVNVGDGFDPIAKAAVAHAQFVTIHPFEDGNGRTARALGLRVLCQRGVAGGIAFPTSASMALDKPRYLDALKSTQTTRGPSDHSAFVSYFAACCEAAALEAVAVVERLEDAVGRWMQVVPAADEGARAVLERFAGTPVMSEAMVSVVLAGDAQSVLRELVDKNVLVRRASEFASGEVFVAPESLDILADAQRLADARAI